MKPTTERFTHTVQNYLKYRPSYPKVMLDVLIKECQLSPSDVIADVGSGTGFLSKLFLDNGNTVYGVEPNLAMRDAAQFYLKNYPHFHNIDGTAESIPLAAQSIDMITAGTAFHWFDVKETKKEFQRILKPEHFVLLVWNVRDLERSQLMVDYEAFIERYSTDYAVSAASHFDKSAVSDFFTAQNLKTCWFENKQTLNWEGLKGRFLSTSYSLQPQHPEYKAMLVALRTLFETHQQDGFISFLYKTKLYYGRIT